MPLENVHGTPIFTKINKNKKQCKYLTKDIETEVIIIGGGVTGSIVGYYFSKANIFLYTSKDEEIKEMKDEYEIRKNAGLEVKYISKEDNPFSIDLKGGVYSVNGGAQLDPYKYTHELLDVSCDIGLKFYENTEVIKIKYLENSVEVITSYGYKVRGKKVIIATGYNTERFTKRNFGQKTVTYNIATKPVDNFDGWFNQVLIRDNCNPYNYFRTTDDNRIIAGEEDIDFYNNICNEKVAQEKYKILLNRVKSMFPKIKNIESEFEYCGGFISSQDNLGYIGEDSNHKNQWYCLGYGANGILFAILGGMMLSKFYKNEIDENMKLFKVDRFDK